MATINKPKLTDADYCRAAAKLQCEVAAIKAVAEAETKDKPFYSDGFPVILFERHIFRKKTNGRFSKTHPHLSGPAGGYGKAGANQRRKFSEAFALDADAAMQSCSWGRFQIMGFNYAICGFKNVGAFVDAMKESEQGQLDAFVAYVKNNFLDDELREKKWGAFARGYNGPDYKKNQYDTKMAAFYKKFAAQKLDCKAVLAAEKAAQNDTPSSASSQASAAASADVSGERTEPTTSLSSDTTVKQAEQTSVDTPPITIDSETTIIQPQNPQQSPQLTPEIVTQQIPRIQTGVRWLGTLGVGGIASTTFATVGGWPPWALFVLGAVTAVVLGGLVWLFIRYYSRVFDLVKTVARINADPNLNIIQLVGRGEATAEDCLPSVEVKTR